MGISKPWTWTRYNPWRSQSLLECPETGGLKNSSSCPTHLLQTLSRCCSSLAVPLIYWPADHHPQVQAVKWPSMTAGSLAKSTSISSSKGATGVSMCLGSSFQICFTMSAWTHIHGWTDLWFCMGGGTKHLHTFPRSASAISTAPPAKWSTWFSMSHFPTF